MKNQVIRNLVSCRKFAIGGNERLFKERLDNSAAYASLAYCLKNKDGDEVAPGVFAKSIIARNEQNGNDLVIYFSGINPTREEWLDKIFTLGNYEPFSSIIKVDRNFWNSFSNMTILKEKIVKTLQGTSNKQIDTVRFIGHSLGGVYAMFAAATLHNTQGNDRVEVFTFGQPPIGNYEFAKWFNSLSKKNLIAFRVTHSDDIIPRLPIDKPKVPLFHHAVEVWIDANCDCYQNEQVYVCHGPIENGFYTESDQCNKGSKTMGGHAHNGPYFGHYMGVCPFLQFENDQIYLENLNNIFMQ
ncbi:hypothetical protein G9A89_020124 [Geosiphon pyriformis]|nr:hypothetical protein G9A89_020124 [Geosiphon pyriformis]